MGEVWSLPGFEVQALLGSGATAEVWRARERATGDLVALKRLSAGCDPAAVDALRRDGRLLRDLDTPHVVRLRDVLDSGAGTVLVLDHAAGGSLAELLATRRSLDPGEVVTVAAPLAQALAAAHRRGLVHGRIAPSKVLLTADGMPLLCGLGLLRGADGPPAADVRALAALCHRMLTHRLSAPVVPPALAAAVAAGLAATPGAGPDAAAFGALLRRAHAAAPVRFVSQVPGSRTSAARHADVEAARPRLPQGLLRGVALGALLVVGGLAGWLSGGGAQPAPVLPRAAAPVAAPSPAAADWAALLEALDADRARAFAAGDLDALRQVYAAGSTGLASDRALLRSLLDQRQTAHGLRHEVRSVEVVGEGADGVELRVVDVLAAYEVRDARGAVVSRAAARGQRAFRVTLTRTAGGWRLVEVRPGS